MLERLGVSFSVALTHAPELERGRPEYVARENALRKARAAWARDDVSADAVVGCDTIVALNGEIYGKPADEQQARHTLRALSGSTHEVISGLAVLVAGEDLQERVAVARTAVTFRVLGDALLEWYLKLGEWRDRAGGYAIQGAGSALVRELAGDYENVVGLPLATLLDIYPELLE